jgi:uncharacterized caspase-like protein
VGLFYFSGHGMQYQGKNFLFPIGAMSLVSMPEHLPFETLNVDYLLASGRRRQSVEFSVFRRLS